MKLGLCEIEWGYIGSVLARQSDVEQTEFFKAFIKECNSWGTEYQVQSQLAMINLKMTDAERETLRMLSIKE